MLAGMEHALGPVEEVATEHWGSSRVDLAVPQEADHAVAPRIRADLAARSSDATIEEQLAGGVIEDGVAGDERAEAPRLDAFLVDAALDAGNAARLLPGLVAHLLVREAGKLDEDDLSADRARVVAQDHLQFVQACARAVTVRMREQHQRHAVRMEGEGGILRPYERRSRLVAGREFEVHERRRD